MKASEYKAPFLPYDEIRLRAEDFLGRYNREDKIPVPIDEIVEFTLNIEIIPRLGLKQTTGTDGFISNDLQSIYIDMRVFEEYYYRYRFTLAHEIGHMFLHNELYSPDLFVSIEEWENFIKDIAPKQYGWLEYHADCFAGLILVPSHHLKNSFKKAVAVLENAGFNMKDLPEITNRYIARYINDEFKVSDGVILRRLKYDGLIESY